MGAWKAAYMFDDYTIVYHRAWDYGDFTPDRGIHKRTRTEVRLNVTGTFCLRCAVPWMCTPGLLPELHPQRGRRGLRGELLHRPELGEEHGTVQAQEDRLRCGRGYQEEFDFLLDGI